MLVIKRLTHLGIIGLVVLSFSALSLDNTTDPTKATAEEPVKTSDGSTQSSTGETTDPNHSSTGETQETTPTESVDTTIIDTNEETVKRTFFERDPSNKNATTTAYDSPDQTQLNNHKGSIGSGNKANDFAIDQLMGGTYTLIGGTSGTTDGGTND